MEYVNGDGKYDLSESRKLLKIHKRMYLGGVNGGILMDHFMSLKRGLKFLKRFLFVSENKELIQRTRSLVFHVMQKLDSLKYLGKDERLVMNLEQAYADLREEMKNVIIKPETNEYDVIFPETITRWCKYNETSVFLCKRIDRLVSSYCKANRIAPVMKELEDIRNMLNLLRPFFTYAKYVTDRTMFRPLTVQEQEVFATITAVLNRAECFIYSSFVGKMNDEMFFSLKNSFSDLIIEEAQIMRMYFIIDIDSVENLESRISMSLRLLEWNKNCYSGTEIRATLENHFMSIEHSLQVLVQILKFSTNNDLKLRIQHLIAIVKNKLYAFPHYEEDVNLIVKLAHAYGELREEMQNVVMKPGTDDYDMLFPELIEDMFSFVTITIFLVGEINVLVTSSCKADQIAPVMKELEELMKKLTSLSQLYVKLLEENEEKVVAAV